MSVISQKILVTCCNDKIFLNTKSISPSLNLCIHCATNYQWKIDFVISNARSILSQKSKGIPMDTDGGNHPLHIFVYDLESRRTWTNHKKKTFVSCGVNSVPGNFTVGVEIDRQKLDQFHKTTSQAHSENTVLKVWLFSSQIS